MTHYLMIGSANRFILYLLLFFSFLTTNVLANSKAEELQRKIADIGLLAQQLSDRKKEAEAALKSLTVEKRNLIAEIRLLKKSLGIKTYQQIKKSERAYYNIELLRTIIAYSNEFKQKIKVYQTGNDKLTYLQQLAEDDIKMIRTLNDLEIDALATQISLVINKYLGEAHIIQIDPKTIDLEPSEKIWEDIARSRY